MDEEKTEKEIDQTIDQSISEAAQSIEQAEHQVEQYHEEFVGRQEAGEPERNWHEAFKQTEAKLNETFDLLLRTKADFDNYRKRVIKEKGELIERASDRLILEILPILDNFELALSHAESKTKESKALKVGVELIFKQFNGLLEKLEVKALHTVGEKFDPTIHEAIAHENSEEIPAGLIISEKRKGYMIKDRLLRTPLVVVSKGSSKIVKLFDDEQKDKEQNPPTETANETPLKE